MLFITLIFAFLAAASMAWGLLPDATRRIVRRRIYSEVQAKKQPSFVSWISNLLRPINQRLASGWYLDRTSHMLEAAGIRGIPALQTLAVQQMGAFIGVIIYFVTLGHQGFDVVWLVLFAAAGFLVPSFWLNSRARTRRLTFSRDLPELVDLLTLCVVAGSDFMAALTRIVREFKPCPVREELQVVLQEVRLGKRRRDALRAFANRLRVPEATTFSRTLIQVDRMGTGLAEAMTILSDDMRLQRYNWAERFAQQAPMKMLVPLICSLFAAMAVVAGPIFIQFMRGGLMNPSMSVAEQSQSAQQQPPGGLGPGEAAGQAMFSGPR